MTEERQNFQAHPIQLASLNVAELHIEPNVAPDKKTGVEESEVTISSAYSEYDEEENLISVAVKAEVGMSGDSDSPPPFSMRVEVTGNFTVVDKERFPMDEIQHWAEFNAPMILFPYVREHVFSLTARCGFDPMILPLLEVPTVEAGEES